MSTNETQMKSLQKVKELLDLVQEGLTRKEFIDSFKAVIKLTTEIEKKLITKIDSKISDTSAETEKMRQMMGEMREQFLQTIKEAKSANETTFAGIKKRSLEAMQEMFRKMDVQGQMDKMYAEHEKMMSTMSDKEAQMKAKMDEMKEIEPETAEQTIEKINSSEAQIDKERVKGLEDEINALRKEIATKTGGVRRVFQPYIDDFSAQTNGSLKTFTLSREPLRTNTIQVFGTDFPTILRPTVDFTVSGRTLTLTSAVPAPSTGATLLIHYFS